MARLVTSMHHFVLFLILIHSASPYKIYASDDNRSEVSSDSSSWDDDINSAIPIKNLGYGKEDADLDSNYDNSPTWLSHNSKMGESEEPIWKRSFLSKRRHSSNVVPQRRSYRPHRNPLVAAYKRCAELSTSDDRESCFKDAIQILFVHKLRK